MSELRHYQVGMSVEALASAWARTENAPAGSVVVIDTEIAARIRGGVPWTLGGDRAVAMAVVARPNLEPLKEALLWLVVSLAAAEALTEVTGDEHTILWPDRVVRVADDLPRCSTNVTVQLGPGRIEHAVLAVRVALGNVGEPVDVDKAESVATLSRHLTATLALVESDRVGLVERFTSRCALIDHPVKAELLPRGSARGRATAIDPDGFLVLHSSTGMIERVAPASLRSIEVVTAPGTV